MPGSDQRADGDPFPSGFDTVDVLAAAAHELKTPLTTLAGIAETLHLARERIRPADVDELLLAMEAQSLRLATMVDDLLSLGRWHHLHGEITGRVLARDAVEGALEAAPAPDRVTMRQLIDPASEDLEVIGDLGGLTRAVVNLLTNAYKHGGDHVTIAVLARSEGAEIRVEDDGPGVPRELRGSLFVPFVRGEPLRSNDPRGCGLGLALARQIVESFGGRLEHDPVNPCGARFTITLRTASPEDASGPRALD